MSNTVNGTMNVTKMYSKAGQIIKEENAPEETIAIKSFETEPAKVNVDLSLTINLGNYESLKLGCGVMLPCYVEEIVDAQETAFKIAETELFKRATEVKENL